MTLSNGPADVEIRSHATRVIVEGDIRFTPRSGGQPWEARGEWPARWIGPASSDGGAIATPWFAEFRLDLTLDAPLRTIIHLTADERYELFLDGVRVGRGPERGDRTNWYYESFDLQLAAGAHTLVAHVHALGPDKPWAQVTVRPGFLLCPDDAAAQPLLATGMAAWKVRLRPQLSTRRCVDVGGIGTGPEFVVDARIADAPWTEPIAMAYGNNGFELYVTSPTHWTRAATLPSQMSIAWTSARVRAADDREAGPFDEIHQQEVFDPIIGEPLHVPARSTRRVLLDLGNYACVYPRVSITGGGDSRIDLRFAEALVEVSTSGDRSKRNRDRVQGMSFVGYGDSFITDGGPQTFEIPWWRCGRFIQLVITTADEPLTLSRLEFKETRYPLSIDGSWNAGDPRETVLMQRCLRTLQMCMHETYMDCPFYEQLMYVGDTRIQSLLTHAISRDVRMPRKALVMADSSRTNATGLSTSNHPASDGQMIPPFALWYLCMIRDHAMYQGDEVFVRSLLPGARAITDVFLQTIDASGLHRSMRGWNFVDWTFAGGIPPGGAPGESSAVLNFQLVLALDAMSDLENFTGEPELAARFRRHASSLFEAVSRSFWNDERGCFADDVKHEHFSQHTQLLAILTGRLSADASAGLARRVLDDSKLTPTALFFTDYRFEAAAMSGCGELIESAMPQWHEQVNAGLRTMPENATMDTRSDCHAWAAHPLYHLIASVAGVRPDAMGFARVRIRPLLGARDTLSITTPHPLGTIRVALRREGSKVHASIDTPVPGVLIVPGQSIELIAGKQEHRWHEA